MTERGFQIFACDAVMVEQRIGEFSALLQACVHNGASISFVMPFSLNDAEAFWRGKVLPGVAAGSSLLLAAEAEGRIAGSVQLDHDTPPNQPHRAEVRKLLVHPDFRRRGLARALMAELEAHARLLRRSLLTLDTRTGDRAEPLYASLGYQTVGVIPNFCRDPFAADKLDGTTIMYKAL
ncbi:GNAT family N-acetyltransferase [Neoaquamicrobium sediminum]|uniref:GNAT family N-acetyltransferase n=1 Tax=Neoaquamicrobium sediminum TaxID=1849104 RepID=UPI003BA893D7